jgi:2-methylcitrate dehydratase
MSTLAQRMADYAGRLTFESLPAEVVHEAKRVVIDSLGVALGAWREEPCRIARDLANHYAARREFGATVLGTNHHAPPDWAAFANGICVRYFDYNDTYLSKEPAHPSDNITACLAAAELAGKGGRDLITAIVLAYEVQCRLCDAASIRARGWDHPTYGAFSTALAASYLLDLDHKRTVHALGITGTNAAQMRQTRAGELSHWKGVAFAHAARHGVFSAVLAQHGMTGPAPIFEGVMGFEKQVSGPLDDLEGPFAASPQEQKGGGDFMIRRSFIKNWPAEYHSQSALAAAQRIREQIGGDMSRVDRILCRTHKASYEIIGSEPEKWRPEARETADHSLPYMVAAMLVDGDVTDATFERSRFTDAELLKVVDKVKVVDDPEMTALYPEHIANIVTVTTTDGRETSERVDDAPGHVHNRLSDEGLLAKYHKLADPVIGEPRATQVADWVMSLDEHERASELMPLLVVGDA